MSEDPRSWGADDVDRFCAQAEPEEAVGLILTLAANPDQDALRVLQLFLGARHDDTFLKAIPSRVRLSTPSSRRVSLAFASSATQC